MNHQSLVIDFRVFYSDSLFHYGHNVVNLLCGQDAKKKQKILYKCQELQLDFNPFVCFHEGALEREATAFLKRLAHMYESY